MDHSENNSGSMQSSSGGDDQEYEFNSTTFGSISNNRYAPQPPPPPLPPLVQPTLFDHQFQANNNLHHPFSHSPANLDLVWSRSDEPNYSTLGNLTPLSSSSSSFPPSTQSQLGPGQGPLQSLHDGNTTHSRVVAPPNSVSDHQNQTNVGKTSRKRTRASRRAPTTVLTTDASNFRQMVQEFTGIPAQPFSASPYSRRLDLFGGGSTAMRPGHLDALGPLYPFRPSAQKVQQNPFVSSTSSSSSPSMLMTNTLGSTNNNDASTFASSYQMNMQNPILNSSFQSLLQSSGPHFGTKSQGSLGIPSMDHELGMGQQHVNATNLGEFSMQLGGSTTNNNLTRSMWRGENGADDDQDQHLGSLNGSNGRP